MSWILAVPWSSLGTVAASLPWQGALQALSSLPAQPFWIPEHCTEHGSAAPAPREHSPSVNEGREKEQKAAREAQQEQLLNTGMAPRGQLLHPSPGGSAPCLDALGQGRGRQQGPLACCKEGKRKNSWLAHHSHLPVPDFHQKWNIERFQGEWGQHCAHREGSTDVLSAPCRLAVPPCARALPIPRITGRFLGCSATCPGYFYPGSSMLNRGYYKQTCFILSLQMFSVPVFFSYYKLGHGKWWIFFF